jgi:hypothetical protein
MTEADRPAFMQAFNRLSVSLPKPREVAGDETVQAGQMMAYWEALKDLPVDAVVEAAAKLQRQGSGFFPSTQEWYRRADDLAYQRLLDQGVVSEQLPAGDETAFAKAKRARARFLAELRAKPNVNGWDFAAIADVFEKAIPCRDPERFPGARIYCDVCQDSGWVARQCVDGDRCAAHADVDRSWGEHEHRQCCACTGFNPVMARRLEMARHRRA